MSYKRVLPRDLFNEANLLKCYGRLVLLIEEKMIDWIQYHHDGDSFYIKQNPSDGSLSIANIEFWTRGPKPKKIHLSRPLNSRESWPLWACIEGEEEDHPVFGNNGSFMLEEPSDAD